MGRVVISSVVADSVFAQFVRAAQRDYEIYSARRRSAGEIARAGEDAPPGGAYGTRIERRFVEDLALLTGAVSSARSLSAGFVDLWRPRLAALVETGPSEAVACLEDFALALETEVAARTPSDPSWDMGRFKLARLESELDKIRVGWAGLWRALTFEVDADCDGVRH